MNKTGKKLELENFAESLSLIVVSGALWDFNPRYVYKDGMGWGW
jgi:hypothetical protein